MDPCFLENLLKCSEKLEDIVMLRKNVLSLTISMTIDILKMPVCLLMISKMFILYRMTEKAIKTSNL